MIGLNPTDYSSYNLYSTFNHVRNYLNSLDDLPLRVRLSEELQIL